MRLFIGVRPGPEILKELVALQQAVITLGGKPVARENLHLTLKFLGRVDSDGPWRERLAQIGVCSRCVQPLDQLMAFPHSERARLLAVGCRRACEGLQRIYRLLGTEDREFIPHITLTRLRVPVTFASREVTPLSLEISRLTLYQSHLDSAGSRYEILQEFPLAAP